MNTETPEITREASRGEVQAKRRVPVGRIVALTLILVAASLLVTAAVLRYLATSEAGARRLWQMASRIVPGRLSGEVAGGSLADGLKLRNVIYTSKTQEIRIDKVDGDWTLSFSPLKLTIRSLHVGTADILLHPTPPEPATFPQKLTLPLELEILDLRAEHVLVRKQGSEQRYESLRLHGRSDKVQHHLTVDRLTTPYGEASAVLQMNGVRPFPLTGTARLNGAYEKRSYQANLRLSGSLQELNAQVDVSADKLSGRAIIDATPFADLPFRLARIEASHFDPRVFNAEWPQADIALKALLEPSAPAGSRAGELVVTGNVSLTNDKAGPIDKGLVPLVSARAALQLDDKERRLSGFSASLGGPARLEGEGRIDSEGNGKLSLQVRDLDPHALHTSLKPTSLKGPIEADFKDGQARRIVLDLGGPAWSLSAKAGISEAKIELFSAALQSGEARLELKGEMARAASSAYELSGTLRDFNPALFVTIPQERTKKSKSPSRYVTANINTDFSADGALKPEPRGRVDFRIFDSVYADLPMTGGGTVQFAGKQILPSAAQLSIAGNNMNLEGSFGRPGDRLAIDIDAPALDRLGFGLSGRLEVQGTLAGTLARPVIDARYTAEELVMGDMRVAAVNGNAYTAGTPASTPNAAIRIVADAKNLRLPDLTLDKLALRVDGTYASHEIRLDSNGLLRGKPLDMTLAAKGRLHDRERGLGWNGTVGSLDNRGLPRFHLESPAPLSLEAGRFELGSTRLTLAQATIEIQNLLYSENVLRSAGSFKSLNIGNLLELRKQFTGEEAPAATDLVLDGRWQFSLAERADGFIDIERTSGDLRTPGGTALGLSRLSLRARLRERRLEVDLKADSTRVGSAEGNGMVALQLEGGRLSPSPASRIDAAVKANFPRLQSIASLAGPQIAVSGSAVLDVKVEGTLGKPVVSGVLEGDRLALTWYDQGVRLHDGTVRIALNENVAELRRFEFRGGEGRLTASGSIPLDRTGRKLSAVVIAERLQLLSSPSAQLTLSGRANAVSSEGVLTLGGRFNVDRALFSLPEKAAPRLDDDVIVIRGDPRKAPARKGNAPAKAGPFTPRVDIMLDLGDAFYFNGSGADLRLAGVLRLFSEPGEEPQAVGAVRIAEGTYEAFGTELVIERGVINFSGPLKEPNLNIVAMRREEDVAAGVRITGNVDRPRVQVISEPEMPQEEKLSWLVFGRPGGGNEQGQAQAAAKGAALGLLNKFGSNRVAKSIGLDSLSIGASEYGKAGTQVVSLGKEISDRLFIGFEQSLSGTESALKLTYQLGRYWSVVLRGGAVTGMDVNFNKRFDDMR